MSKKNRVPVNLVQLATQLAAQTSLWEPLVDYDPVSRYYARLARESDFEAWLLTWVPGQGTEWHGHGGSAGAFITVRGVLNEEHAVVSPDGLPRVVPKSRDLTEGSLRPFGSKHVHKVTNLSLEPAVSLHVYAPSLVEMHVYEQHGELLHLINSQLVGLNW